jgi:hypothetical protein
MLFHYAIKVTYVIYGCLQCRETNIYGVSCIQDIMVVPVLEPDTELLSVTFPPGEEISLVVSRE